MCPLSPYDVLRDATLPAVSSTCILMESLIATHARMTGQACSWRQAATVLDRLREERGERFWEPRPIPDPYAEVEFWLNCQGYSDDAVRLIVRHVEARGTSAGCPWVDGEDRGPLDEILPYIRKPELMEV